MLETPFGLLGIVARHSQKPQNQSFAAHFFEITGSEKAEIQSVYRKTRKAVQ
jgi:hypothetical protein